jgi:putative transposase
VTSVNLGAGISVPEQVIVLMADIAESAKEGLLALAVGTGMQVMAAMFEEDVTRLCGPDGKHNPAGRGTGMAARPGRSPWAGGASRDPAAGAGGRRVLGAASGQL